MIKFLSHTEIDKERWDRCVDQSPSALIYANSWYLDIVSPGWNALVADDYSAVFPLTRRKKWGFEYLYQPPFTQQLGLFISVENEENTLANFLEKLPESIRLIEIQLNQSNSLFSIPPAFQVSKKITHILDLSLEATILKKNISENTKRNIRTFEKSSATIQNDLDADELVKLFRNNRGKNIRELQENDYSIFLALCREAKQRKLFICMGSRDLKGNLLAGVIFFHTQSGFILLFSAVSEEGKASGAMSALISGFILEHAGYKGTLDFEGSMDPGLARFYKSFGSHEIVYLQIRNNRLPALIRWLKN